MCKMWSWDLILDMYTNWRVTITFHHRHQMDLGHLDLVVPVAQENAQSLPIWSQCQYWTQVLSPPSSRIYKRLVQNGILRLNNNTAGKYPVISNMKSGSILETSSHPPCHQSKEQSFKKVWIYTRLGWMLRNNATKEDEINLIFLLGHWLPSNEWHKLGSNKYDLFNFSPLPKKSIACLNRTHCALLFWKSRFSLFPFCSNVKYKH